jgi:hypothetical protein
VLLDERGQEQVPAGGQGAAVEEDAVQRGGAVVDPALEGVEQGVAVDEVVLERQQPKQEVAIGGTGHGMTSIHKGTAARDAARIGSPASVPESSTSIAREETVQWSHRSRT